MAESVSRDAVLSRLADLQDHYNELISELSSPELAADPPAMQRLLREQSELSGTMAQYQRYLGLEREITEAQSLLDDGADAEMRTFVREELTRLESERAPLFEQLADFFRPRDPNDARNVILEIRAGTGGEEASLFAGDLLRMYLRYAELKNWQTEVMNTSETDLGGIKDVTVEIRGLGAFSRLKYESGVHRVQRVPTTEASGRIHTSTATVAVLPEVDEVDVQIRDEDLKIDVYRAGGHGGQSVNTTDSAVRITHLPTGEVVICQDERSQLKNKLKAMTVLRARLYEHEMRRQHESTDQMRRSMVGSGERAEKIRTYNFPQNRITDHRIGLTLHNLSEALEGSIEPMVDALSVAAEREATAV
ncbi:MAG: peptide chain release factor 1 [Chloroflexota bacterium]